MKAAINTQAVLAIDFRGRMWTLGSLKAPNFWFCILLVKKPSSLWEDRFTSPKVCWSQIKNLFTIVSSHAVTASLEDAILNKFSKRPRYAASFLATHAVPTFQFCKLETARGLAISKSSVCLFLMI